MPIYEYAHISLLTCPDFETYERMRDDALTVCPTCGKQIQRVISMPRVIVKGGPESPQKSVERVLGQKKGEQYFENPYTGKRIKLKGSKAERKRQVQDSVVNSPLGKRRNLKRSDVTVPNL